MLVGQQVLVRLTTDLRGHREIEGEESDIVNIVLILLFWQNLPGTQSEVIQALERSVGNLSETFFILNQPGGLARYDQLALERNKVEDQDQEQSKCL